VVAPAHTIRGMELNQRQVPTGTYCGGNHPQQIEYRYALVNGAEILSGQSDPRCFRAGCPDNVAALAKERRRDRPKS
jgi:hypothetical protein